jgi:hypothetical protein
MLGGFSISQECADKIMDIYPRGTILELGSGQGTEYLSKRYTMYSIEHNQDYLGKYNSTYIYAPIINGWYDPDFLRNLPDYGLLLIDGPPSTIKPNIRMGFMRHFEIFNLDAILVVDDVHRRTEFHLANALALMVDREIMVYGNNKKFAFI